MVKHKIPKKEFVKEKQSSDLDNKILGDKMK
jgi:hypothetical protein